MKCVDLNAKARLPHISSWPRRRREGGEGEALELSYKWKTNNRFSVCFLPALFCRLPGRLAPGLCWCVAQQQSEVIISLAVSIRFNFSSRLHLPESLDCVTVYRWNQCRAAESLYLSKRSQASPKGKTSAHMCVEMHTLVHRHMHMHRPLVPRLFIHLASLHTSFYCMYIYQYLQT